MSWASSKPRAGLQLPASRPRAQLVDCPQRMTSSSGCGLCRRRWKALVSPRKGYSRRCNLRWTLPQTLHIAPGASPFGVSRRSWTGSRESAPGKSSQIIRGAGQGPSRKQVMLWMLAFPTFSRSDCDRHPRGYSLEDGDAARDRSPTWDKDQGRCAEPVASGLAQTTHCYIRRGHRTRSAAAFLPRDQDEAVCRPTATTGDGQAQRAQGPDRELHSGGGAPARETQQGRERRLV